MACNRHKRRQGGEVVPVLQGIAKEISPLVEQLHGVSVSYSVARQYRGSPKIRIRWGNRVSEPKLVHLDICDPDHGEGRFRIRTPHPAAIAHALKKGITGDRRLALYREKPGEA